MSITRIASRYAKSLMDLAIERNELDTVLDDVKHFDEFTENRDFYLLLKSPIVNKDKKLSIFKVLFENNFSELTREFLNILVKKGREEYLPEITDQFIEQYNKVKGISKIKLTTAVPVSDSQMGDIKEKLLSSHDTRDHVEIGTEVDEDILGGFILRIEDKIYDASLAHKLAKMKKDFSSNEYVKSF